MNKLSKEQQKVIDYVKKGYNVVIDAVAGCGKTTTSLHICKELHDKKILMLTYNAGLKIDTRNKILKYDITNLEVHSYHSFCVKYYKRECYDDLSMYKLLKENIELDTNFDIIILDEQQDMKPLFYELGQKIIKPDTQLCIFGDVNQNIYSYQGSNVMYLTNADKLFSNNRKWKKLNMKTTFRMSIEIANFINNILLKQERLVATKHGLNVKYLQITTYKPFLILNIIKDYKKRGYNYDDIFILGLTVKSIALQKLENECVKNNIPCFVSTSENGSIDNELIKNKLVITTYHQSKGLERKIVFVYNMDEGYYWYAKNIPKDICPNPIYVACTRVIEELYIIHDMCKDYLPFIDSDKIKDYAKISGNLRLKEKEVTSPKLIKKSVTDLIKGLSFTQNINLLNYFKFIRIKEPSKLIELNSKVENNGLFEDVSSINGTSIPAYYEIIKMKSCKLYDYVINNNLENLSIDQLEQIEKIKNKMKLHKYLSIDNILFLATIYEYLFNGYLFKLNQIKNFKWWSTDDAQQKLEIILDIIHINMSDNLEFEVNISNEDYNGLIDCIDHDKKIIWEFKMVSYIADLHFIQLVIYACISNKQYNNYKYRILNILSGEIMELDIDNSNLIEFYNIIK